MNNQCTKLTNYRTPILPTDLDGDPLNLHRPGSVCRSLHWGLGCTAFKDLKEKFEIPDFVIIKSEVLHILFSVY